VVDRKTGVFFLSSASVDILSVFLSSCLFAVLVSSGQLRSMLAREIAWRSRRSSTHDFSGNVGASSTPALAAVFLRQYPQQYAPRPDTGGPTEVAGHDRRQQPCEALTLMALHSGWASQLASHFATSKEDCTQAMGAHRRCWLSPHPPPTLTSCVHHEPQGPNPALAYSALL
jgi:hypothetical protein